MSEDVPPVAPSEVILRLVVNKLDYYDSSRPIPVLPLSFRPSGNDKDGISVFRESYVGPQDLIRSRHKPANSHVVARMKASDVSALGLSLIPTPDLSELPGHVSIPELSLSNYSDAAKKNAIKEIHKELAELASRDVVHQESPPQ